MALLMSICVVVAGLAGVVFNERLARSMLKFHPAANHSRMLVIGRIAYVLVGLWMIVVGSWVILRVFK